MVINGDGKTSRDFCFIENAMQANLLATMAPESSRNEVYNVAVSDITSLNQLFGYLKSILKQIDIVFCRKPVYGDFRPGDGLHSQAEIGKAARNLGYAPAYRIQQGLEAAMPWYLEQNSKNRLCRK